MATREREFRVPTAEGDLVGWIREPAGAKANALLLHGGPGMNDYTETLADELDGLVTTARYQQRGLSPSVDSGDRSLEGHVADAVAVIDHLGWQWPLVVGHSWGGHLAMHLAVARLERVGGMVLLDALGPVGDGGISEFTPALRVGLSEVQVARLDELDARDILTSDERAERMAMVWPNYFGDPRTAPPVPIFRFDPKSVETWDSINAHFEAATLERGLPTVIAQALIVHGDRSPIPIDQARRTVELMPNARLAVVKGGGHWPWLEHPGFVREQIEEFLGEL